MYRHFITLFLLLTVIHVQGQVSTPSEPMVKESLIFDEVNHVIPVEAEYFYEQEKTDVRFWVRQNASEVSAVSPDPDAPHLEDASNNSYIEVLPDNRVTNADKLTAGINFSNEPGAMAIVHYKVNIHTPGRYYVWVRAHSSGSEDNGIHVGIDGAWPEHGQRMQWCEDKFQWTWASKQRTEEEHCGVPKEIYLDIEEPGVHDIQFSMREDGFEFDKFILTRDIDYIPEGKGEVSRLVDGEVSSNVPENNKKKVANTADKSLIYIEELTKTVAGNKSIKATDFPIENTSFYKHNNWLAINPETDKTAKTSIRFPYEDGTYDIVFVGVGESDGQSEYAMFINQKKIFSYSAPLSKHMYEEGNPYNYLIENVYIKKGDVITVMAKTASADGQEYSRGRWAGILFSPVTFGKEVMENAKMFSVSRDNTSGSIVQGQVQIDTREKDTQPKRVDKNGKGDVQISGELKQWHKVNLTLDGPFAKETDVRPNPFTDYRMTVLFKHESGSPVYKVPAYFAADGHAGETSASEGSKWRAHLSPDKTGTWTYEISFYTGAFVATADMPWMKTLSPYDGIKGSFEIDASDKTGKDFRAKGRLTYVGKHHLQFAGNGEYFYKCGSDAPETLLAFADFDNTLALKPKVPLKTYAPHVKDFKPGDPTWKDGKGKGLIGAINYLSDKGLNSVSFLSYNAGGDGDNVWPFTDRDAKFHYDCSKLDQWQIVFDHAQSKGLYLHFKTQETENDDNFKGNKRAFEIIPEALDGGDLGPERILYYRELIARFGYLLALNWNLGEENTQSTENQKAMAAYFYHTDPYMHNIVLHTYPNQQESTYTPLLGDQSKLTGVSLQNKWDDVFKKTLYWVNASSAAGKPWVVANDEQGGAGEGVPPDPGYKGFDATTVGYSIHDIRKQTLWGNLMAGGAGVEYYFGYKLPENDLLAEDFRSRDKSWDYCRHAIHFLSDNEIPFEDMTNRNALIGNTDMNKDKYCLAKKDDIYLIYLAYVPTSSLDLSETSGQYRVQWFDPVKGGKLLDGSIKKVRGGKLVELGKAPYNPDQDWVVVVRKK